MVMAEVRHSLASVFTTSHGALCCYIDDVCPSCRPCTFKSQLVDVVKKRRRYCDLYTKVLDKEELTGKDAEDYELLVEEMAVDVLVAWRMLVEKKRAVSVVAGEKPLKSLGPKRMSSRKPSLSKAPSGRKEGSSTWMSWFRGGQKGGAAPAPVPAPASHKEEDEDEEDEGWGTELVTEEEAMPSAHVAADDISLEDLALQVAEEEDNKKTIEKKRSSSGKDFELFRITMTSKGTLRLFGRDNRCLLESTSAFNLQANQKGETMSAAFQLAEFAIIDRYTPTALFENIVKVGGDTKESIVDLRVVMEPQANTIRMRTRPLDIAYIPSWVVKLLKLFNPPEGLKEALVDRAANNITQARAFARENLAGTALRVDVEISAPRIFVPVSESRDFGFLLLDTGRLSIKGGTAPDDNKVMMYDIKLSDIQSKVPKRKSDWVVQQAGSISQLIEPFSIGMSVRMRQPDEQLEPATPGGHQHKPPPSTEADMTLAMELKPGVKGVATPSRLKRLMYVLTHASLPEEDEENRETPGVTEFAVNNQPRRPQLDALGVTDRISIVVPHPPPPKPVDLTACPEHKRMDVRITIPQIALELDAEVEDGETVDTVPQKLFYLSIDGFEMAMLSRSYDSTIDVTLGSFSIMSLRRPEELGSYRYLVQSLADSDTTSLIHVQMVDFVAGDKSPLYKGFDGVRNITFSQLCLNCDANSILLLKPFYGAIMNPDDLVPLDIAPMRRTASMGKYIIRLINVCLA